MQRDSQESISGGPDKKHPVLTGTVKSGAVRKRPILTGVVKSGAVKKRPVLTGAVKSGALKKRPVSVSFLRYRLIFLLFSPSISLALSIKKI